MTTQTIKATLTVPHKEFYQHLYFQVLVAILLGILLGYFYPSVGESLKPLGDAFIQLVRMLIAPIIFCTVVHGIASSDDAKKVGRVGLKAVIYFEILTTIALVLGLVCMHIGQPGAGMNIDPARLTPRPSRRARRPPCRKGLPTTSCISFANTVVGAFAQGEILQVLFFSVLFAFAMQTLGERGKPFVQMVDIAAHGFFAAIGFIMKVAPIGAFGSMAFTIGKYGLVFTVIIGQAPVVSMTMCLSSCSSCSEPSPTFLASACGSS